MRLCGSTVLSYYTYIYFFRSGIDNARNAIKIEKSCFWCKKNTWHVEYNYIVQPANYLILYSLKSKTAAVETTYSAWQRTGRAQPEVGKTIDIQCRGGKQRIRTQVPHRPRKQPIHWTKRPFGMFCHQNSWKFRCFSFLILWTKS